MKWRKTVRLGSCLLVVFTHLSWCQWNVSNSRLINISPLMSYFLVPLICRLVRCLMLLHELKSVHVYHFMLSTCRHITCIFMHLWLCPCVYWMFLQNRNTSTMQHETSHRKESQMSIHRRLYAHGLCCHQGYSATNPNLNNQRTSLSLINAYLSTSHNVMCL